MEAPLTAFVVDIGSLTTRCGYAGDDCPRQLHASCVGWSSFHNTRRLLSPCSSSLSSTSLFSASCQPGAWPPQPVCGTANSEEPFLFPLSFSAKRKYVSVQPCLYPSFSPSSHASAELPSSSRGFTPSYCLHEDVFECLLRCSVEGSAFNCCSGADLNIIRAPSEISPQGGCASASLCKFIGEENSVTTSSLCSSRSCVGSSRAASCLCTFCSQSELVPQRERNGKNIGSKLGERRQISRPRYRETEFCGLGEGLHDFPLLLSEPNLHCVSLREKMAEVSFEKLSCPALYIAPRAQLVCVAVGRSSGLVIDIGASSTSVAPVVEGFVLHREAGEWPVAGNLLDQLLAGALLRHNLPLLPLFASYKKFLSFYEMQQYMMQLRHTSKAAQRAPIPPPSNNCSSVTAAVKAVPEALTSHLLFRNSCNSSVIKEAAQQRQRAAAAAALDWTDVEASYMQRSQCEALRMLKEGFFHVAAAGSFDRKTAAAAAAAPLLDGATSQLAGRSEQEEHPLSGSLDDCSSSQPCMDFSKQQRKQPFSSRFITVLPSPPDYRPPGGLAYGCLTVQPSPLLGRNPLYERAVELPDGTLLQANELATAIPEVLFSPGLILQRLQQEEKWLQHEAVKSFRGLGEAVREVAGQVESIESRREVVNGIILTGGCSAMPGLYERLNYELQNDPSISSGLRWRLLAAPSLAERKFSAWVGGSILASMAAFQSMWCSREEYYEHGAAIVERKCY